MGYALFSARKIYIHLELNRINYEIMKLMQQRHDLETYGTSLSDGYLDFGEMMSMPIQMRPFALQYAMNGHTAAMIGAQSDYQMGMMQLMMQPTAQQFGQQQLAMFAMNLQRQAFETRLKEAKKAEEARIHQIENEMDMKLEKLKTRQKALESELQSVEQGEDAGIKRSVPKYA